MLVKRRTRVAVLFHNKESALRLVTGILMEIHEEWITGRQYLDMTELEENENINSLTLNKVARAG